MELETHFIISIIFCTFLYPLFGGFSFLVILGGFLVDGDHYLWYILKKKDFSLTNAITYCRKEIKNQRVLHIGHTIEVGIILFVLSWLYPFLIPLFVGFLVHMLADLYHTYMTNCWYDRVNSIVIWLYVKNCKSKKSNS